MKKLTIVRNQKDEITEYFVQRGDEIFSFSQEENPITDEDIEKFDEWAMDAHSQHQLSEDEFRAYMSSRYDDEVENKTGTTFSELRIEY